jgi:hypothetical protein
MLKIISGIVFFAVCIFWFIGAYNRLVRLRAVANESVGQLQVISNSMQIDCKNPKENESKLTSEERDKELELQVKLQITKDAHVSEIALYNQAIKEFPASLIAATFSFKPLILNDEKTT